MFNFIEDLAKAAVGVVVTPIAVVADVVTLGGLTTARDSYTAEVVGDVLKNLENAITPKD